MMISLHLELQNLSMRTLGNVLGCAQGLPHIGALVGLSLQQQTMLHVEVSLTCDQVVVNGQSTHTMHEHIWLTYE